MHETHMSPYAIQVRGCTKTFGKVAANHNVRFDLKWGEIHALLGENGSGKTTLVNMLAGIYQPDHGEIRVDGKPVSISNPKDAYRLGIGMIHQHFMLVDVLTAAENIVLGAQSSFLLNKEAVNAKIRAIADSYGFRVDPDQRVADMSVSEKQTVEIIKALYRGARILILDEPTAVLTLQETERLFEILKVMKQHGNAIVLISHKINELFAVADRITILRRGEYITETDVADATVDSLTEGMVGHSVDLTLQCERCGRQPGRVCLNHVTARNAAGVTALRDVSFSADGGEIFGIAGIAGSGQKELCDIIAGLAAPESGTVSIDGKNVTGLGPEDVRTSGIKVAYVPEDRLGMGLIPSLGMADNVMLRCYRGSKGIFVDRKEPEATCGEIIRQLDVSTPGISTPVRKLSGGNVQKVLLGREIHGGPDVLIAAYPVRGLDIGASQKIYEMMNREKRRGACVLFVGEDLDVLMGLCDRLLVLCNGAAAGIIDPRTVTKREIGKLMLGHVEEAAANE